MDDRSAILNSLLAGGCNDTFAPESEPLEDASQREACTASDSLELRSRFEATLAALGGRMGTTEDLALLKSPDAWIEDDCLGTAARLLEVTPEELDGQSRTDLWSASVGVTLADLAIAETGSLLISAGPGKRRLASLAPPVHIVLVPERRLVETLEGAVLGMSDRTTVIVTGPSRTADIEGILIRGVHGPGELIVFWV